MDRMPPFKVHSEFAPAGDQPKAIAGLVEGVQRGDRFQTLLGITGSGKSATIAWTIEAVQKPTLVLAPNKSLAAQLANEFKEFFPENRVEYFVSYYDYYQPEAYMPSSDTYIEKDSTVNDEIDRLRHSATEALLTRRDTIVVASVSAIYGLGSPEEYRENLLIVQVGQSYDQRELLRRLVDMQYERNDMNLVRGKFRVRGDTLEIHAAYEESVIRISMFGDEVEDITIVDPLTGERLASQTEIAIFPATHYVTGAERMQKAIGRIEHELQERLAYFEAEGKLLEAQRLRMRTQYDLEMMAEVGFCSGIENYSAPIDGRGPGEPPHTLIDFFPDDFLMVLDESHQAVPQIHGQYEGDRSRKLTLIDHGFRLPSAADNRPLRFEEWEERVNQCIFMSATPADYEIRRSTQVVEQVVRPTGLVDPEIVVKPTKGQIDDLLEQIRTETELGNRVLVTTLTKKMAEDLTDYLLELGVRVRYLHSNIDTIERIEILRGLRLGEFDVLIGINLLREGLDLPEVTLVAILDADKEGFLRSETSLVQTVGRAARNVDGRVIMYADQMTDSMRRTIDLTQRRRKMQQEYNAEHGINPQTVRKAVTDILAYLRKSDTAPVPDKLDTKAIQRERQVGKRRQEVADLPHADLERLILTLEDEMNEAAADLRFEYAARLRDEIKELKRELREVSQLS
jgi:excinuclease ABC subunit B